MIPDLMRPIRQRLERSAKTLPGPTRRDFARYLHRARRDNDQRTTLRARGGIPPYWLLLPWWIGKPHTSRSNQRILKDVLWGQYCLYLGVRIGDDLFDGQAKYRNLHPASTAFFAEAEKTFLAYIPPTSSFWSYYRGCIRTTQTAILRVDRMQRSPGSRPSSLLREYARVSAIFKIGSFTLCTLLHQKRLVPGVSRFADEMAIAGQILDDFQDISEDLEAGRVNYAARFCLTRSTTKPATQSQLLNAIANMIFLTDAADSIFAMVRQHLNRAAQALSALPLRGGKSYLSRYYTQLNRFETHLHFKRSIFKFSL